MDTAFDIMGLGTVFVDDIIHVPAYPQADTKVAVTREDRVPGGCIANALAAAAALGARCMLLARLGESDLSRYICRALQQAGVDTSRVIADASAGPGHSVILADDRRGSRAICYNMAPCRPLAGSDLPEERLKNTQVLLVDHFEAVAALAVAPLARRLGIPIVLEHEWPDAPQRAELVAAADHVIVSMEFARAITKESQPSQAVQALHNGRAGTVVTCGDQGCYFLAARARDAQFQPAFKGKTVETTGCGDVFHGAYAAALAQGQDVAGCVQVASAAAAVYAFRPSGWQYLARRGEVERMMGGGTAVELEKQNTESRD